MTILSSEDLAIFKVLFSRDNDWRDLREMLLAQGTNFDSSYASGWLERIVAPNDERLRFATLVSERSGASTTTIARLHYLALNRLCWLCR